MRINATEAAAQNAFDRTTAAAQTAQEKAQVFSRTLSDLSGAALRRHAQECVSAIVEQGRQVVKKADIAEFRKYREMIRSLLDETVSNAFEFSKSMRFDAKGRAKTVAVIKKIDKKLESIMDNLLADQADEIQLISDVDEIRGMLVDMFM